MAHQAFKFFILATLLSCYSRFAMAAKILIVTDQPTQQRAKEIQTALKTTPPFSLLKNLVVVIRYLPKEAVVCSRPLVDQPKQDSSTALPATTKSEEPKIPDSCKKMFAQAANSSLKNEAETQAAAQAQRQISDAQRLIVCDTGQALMDITGKENADRTIFVRESDTWGGASGSSITVTTELPPSGTIHELLHSFGFGDEYSYASPCEADTYCPYAQIGSWANIAAFPELAPYPSDSVARQKHSSQIPWYSKIAPNTLITSGSILGTPKPNEIGLHETHVCDLAESKVKSWKPGSETSVMETLETSLVPQIYWEQVAQGLGTQIENVNSPIVKKSAPLTKDAKSKKGVR